MWTWINSNAGVVAALSLLVSIAALSMTWFENWSLRAERRQQDAEAKALREAETRGSLLMRAYALVDELLYVTSFTYALRGLTSDVGTSTRLQATKADRAHRVRTDLETLALEMPPGDLSGLAENLLNLGRSLQVDETQVLAIKSELVRLLNPELSDSTRDDHGLDDGDWDGL